jgi:hypothetical protein
MIHDLNKVPDGIKMCAPTGSRYICDPPPMDTDEDYVVLVQSFTEYAQNLLDQGWTVTVDDEAYDSLSDGEDAYSFITARKGEMNLIIYAHQKGFDRFVAATEVSKRMNLLDKGDRVQVFIQFCRGDYDAE